MNEFQVTDNVMKSVYYSVNEWAEAAKKHGTAENDGDEWAGGLAQAEALSMAVNGWDEHLTETIELAESMVDKVEKDHDVPSFTPVWDVTGAEVDVARYLSGVPENMIDFPAITTPKVGRVITLCASISYSSSVDPDVIKRRGQVLVALALLLSRLGYASELWVAMTARRRGTDYVAESKVQIKSANDALDPARIMFAYAHPAALRMVMFDCQDGQAKADRRFDMGISRGSPMPPIRDLPEGTIYMPELRSKTNVPDAPAQLRGYLRELGLLQES